jgi:RNA-directed DNA polymerase
MRQLMARLGLTVNETKTRLVLLPAENLYSIGRFYGRVEVRDAV